MRPAYLNDHLLPLFRMAKLAAGIALAGQSAVSAKSISVCGYTRKRRPAVAGQLKAARALPSD